MSTGKKGTGDSGWEADFVRTCRDLESKEKAYKELPKETLVNMLMLKEMLDEAFEPEEHGMDLWCFVSDASGVKYVTDKRPEMVHTVPGGSFLMTDGEVNIRVPETMAGIFPDVKYGDEPVKVSLSVSYR